MVYTSDLRGKHLLRDIHSEIVSELQSLQIENKIFLRIFDDPQEDDALWEDGGITFKDPDTGLVLGSNDAAWYYLKDGEPTPFVVVEATFGTERGQFGDGQYNRFSHPMGPAKSGCIGIMLIPFKGESYSKKDGVSDHEEKFASMKYAHLRKDMVRAALGVSEKEKGNYLMIDFYDFSTLKELVKEALKEKLGMKNDLNDVLKKIKDNMSKYAGLTKKPISILNSLHDKNGNIITNSFGALFTQNYAALTTSAKRDGHGLLGKTMTLPYIHPKKKMYSIFVRLDASKIDSLKLRNGKETTYIFNNPNSITISRDDLLFEDKDLEKELKSIENVNLFQNRKKDLINKIIDGLNKGTIRINQ